METDCYVAAFKGNNLLKFGNGVLIGQYSRIGCKNRVILGSDVFTGPNVFIADYNHNYTDISKPIKNQGDMISNNGINIGDDTWIGTNVVIVGDVTIGKHCIVGANSVVNHDIPDYSIAVGSPAKVVKTYDFKTNNWVAYSAM